MTVSARVLVGLIVGAGVLLAAGCDSGNDEDEVPALLRVVHATPGLAPIDFFIDFDLFTRNLAFRSATPYNRWEPGLRRFEVRAAGDPAELVAQDFVLDEDTAYTALVTGAAGDSSFILLQDNRSAPPAGQARLRMVHAARRIGSLTVVATETGGGSMLDVALGRFGRTSAFISIPAGNFDLDVRPTSGGGGPVPLNQSFQAGRRYLIVVTNTAIFAIVDG